MISYKITTKQIKYIVTLKHFGRYKSKRVSIVIYNDCFCPASQAKINAIMPIFYLLEAYIADGLIITYIILIKPGCLILEIHLKIFKAQLLFFYTNKCAIVSILQGTKQVILQYTQIINKGGWLFGEISCYFTYGTIGSARILLQATDRNSFSHFF